jgi:hypothetical protein
MPEVQCKYHKKCDEAPNCGGAKVHDSQYCEPCPRHKNEIVCEPILKGAKNEIPN